MEEVAKEIGESPVGPKGLTMRLKLAESYGPNLDNKLDNVAILVEKRIETATKAIVDKMKAFIDSVESTTLRSVGAKIDRTLESKREQFLSSILEAEEAAKSAVAKIKATTLFLDNMIPDPSDPDYVETVHVKKAQLLSDLLSVEEAARDSVERLKPVIRSIELSTIDRIQNSALESIEKAQVELDGSLAKKKSQIMIELSHVNEIAGESISKIKASVAELNKKLISETNEQILASLSSKKAAFLSEISTIEEAIKGAVSKAADRIETFEKKSMERFNSAVDGKIDPKIKEFGLELNKIEKTIQEKIARIKSEVEKSEAIVLEKLNISTEYLFEKKRTRFLAGMWTGEDLGSEKSPARNIYMKGEAIGLRAENLSKLPEASGAAMGRLCFLKSPGHLYMDSGTTWKKVSYDKVSRNIQWPQGETKLEVDLSNEKIFDAQNTMFQLCDNENGYERVHCRIRTPDKKKLTIEVDEPLAPGAYRLIGVE